MADFTQYEEMLNSKPFRERAIIAGLVLTVVWFIFNLLFFTPLDKEKAELRTRMEVAEKELNQLLAQEKVFAKALTNDPNAVKKREIKQLEAHLDALEKNLQTLSVGLIPANKLADALHDVLNSVGTLNLVGMQTVAPTRLELLHQGEAEQEGSENGTADGAENHVPEVGVFKHSVIVSIEGQYFDVVAYLQALENLQWKIYWESLDYEVKNYPNAKVVIEVYTLSTEEGLLGV